MLWILGIVHVIVCIFLILVVLLQTGRGADLAGAFGMSGSQTAFGPRGTTSLLSKSTSWMAMTFMLTSLSLYIIQSRQTGSVIREPAAVEAPAEIGAEPEAISTPAAAAESEAVPVGDQIIEEETGGTPQDSSAAEQP